MQLYLIRHTAVGVPQGTCYGQTNVPLKETFETEAEIVKNNLNGRSFDAVFSSPLGRCRKLAKYCIGHNITYVDRLKELHMGDWEMKMWDDLDMSRWENDWVTIPAPNGESFQQMYDRVASFFDELKEKDFENVAVFTHGGVISCARVYFKQADIKETFDLMPQYGEIVEFQL